MRARMMAEGGRPVDRVAARPTPLMSKVFGTRRHSLAFLGALPSILDSIRNEAYLWRQEFDLLRRRTLEGLGGPPRSKIQKPSSRPLRLDAEFASALLKDMELAIPSKSAEYSARYAAIRSKEASAFQQAGACPVDCAIPFENATPAQFSNRKYFDFEAYVRGKALLQEEDVQGPLLMDRIGSTVLAKILLDVDVGDAEAVAIAPTRPMGVDALLSASPDLDSIRRGIRALVKYFRAKGFVSGSGIVQFGLSDDEYENHMTWAQGQPAFLVYWLEAPADLCTVEALRSENGVGFSFIGACVAAYLARCGVQAAEYKRTTSLTDSNQVVEQWTLKRVKSLPPNDITQQRYQRWRPDPLPGT